MGIQYFEIFSILHEYLKETNETKKIFYARNLLPIMADLSGMLRQMPSTLKTSYENIDTEIQKSKSSCFIATVVYGNSLSPEVNILRAWRDNYLSKKSFGRQFIKVYYAIGPIFANYITDSLILKRIIRAVLDRLVFVLRARGSK